MYHFVFFIRLRMTLIFNLDWLALRIYIIVFLLLIAQVEINLISRLIPDETQEEQTVLCSSISLGGPGSDRDRR